MCIVNLKCILFFNVIANFSTVATEFLMLVFCFMNVILQKTMQFIERRNRHTKIIKKLFIVISQFVFLISPVDIKETFTVYTCTYVNLPI